MARLFTRDQLPQFDSTRDTHDRLDLIKDDVQVPKPRLHADRVIYHPGDTAAKHYHLGSHHVFVMLDGEGIMFTPSTTSRLKPGMVAVIAPEEVHWFENDTDDNFSFVEFWAPPPSETVWVTDDC